MADSERFVVSDHYVVDTKLRKHAPFGERAGAGVVADQCNANAEFATLFVWVDGDPRTKVGAKRAEKSAAAHADQAQREEPAS